MFKLIFHLANFVTESILQVILLLKMRFFILKNLLLEMETMHLAMINYLY